METLCLSLSVSNCVSAASNLVLVLSNCVLVYMTSFNSVSFCGILEVELNGVILFMKCNECFPIDVYYRRVVIPLDRKRFRIGSGGKMVCPLHDDHDPSLGVTDSGKLHCFGCGYWGNDVVDLHILVMKKYKKIYMSRKEAINDLCRIFGVDKDTVEEADLDDEKSSDVKRDGMIEDMQYRFDISDFRHLLIEGKLKGRNIGYFNALMMSRIYEIKQSKRENND